MASQLSIVVGFRPLWVATFLALVLAGCGGSGGDDSGSSGQEQQVDDETVGGVMTWVLRIPLLLMKLPRLMMAAHRRGTTHPLKTHRPRTTHLQSTILRPRKTHLRSMIPRRKTIPLRRTTRPQRKILLQAMTHLPKMIRHLKKKLSQSSPPTVSMRWMGVQVLSAMPISEITTL